MFNLDNFINENNKNHNRKWSFIPDHPYRMLIIEGSGSGKTSALLNSIKEQDSDELIDKIYLYAKDLNEPNYQFLIKKSEDVGIKHLNNPKVFIEYSQYMDDIYDNFNDYYPNRKIKILIAFDDMIADIMTNKNFQAIIKELFIRSENWIYLFCFSHNLIFLFQKKYTLNCTIKLYTLHNNQDSQEKRDKKYCY